MGGEKGIVCLSVCCLTIYVRTEKVHSYNPVKGFGAKFLLSKQFKHADYFKQNSKFKRFQTIEYLNQ